MPARDFPNLGLSGGYDPHEDGWGDAMNVNLLKLSVLTQGVVIDKVAVEPEAPVAGDVYLLDETNTTNPNAIALFDGPAGAETWAYISPEEGWKLFNKTAGYFEVFDGTIWAEFESGFDDAPADGKVYGRKDSGWTEIVSDGGGDGGGGSGLPSLAGNEGKILRVKNDGSAAEWGFNYGVTPLGPEPHGKHRYWRMKPLRTEHNGYAVVAELKMRSEPSGPSLAVGGSPLSGGHLTTNSADRAFDGDVTTHWESQLAPVSGGGLSNGSQWVGYDFGSPVSIIEIEVTVPVSYETDERPFEGWVDYSDDGVNWTPAWPWGTWDWSDGLVRVGTSPYYSPTVPSEGGESGWEVLRTYDFATDGTASHIDQDVTGYDDVVCIIDRLTTTGTANRMLRFSTDGGVTFDEGPNYHTVDALTGAIAFKDIGFFANGDSSQERTMSWLVSGVSVDGSAKPVNGTRRGIYTETAPITHVRVGTQGVITGGRMFVMGRKAEGVSGGSGGGGSSFAAVASVAGAASNLLASQAGQYLRFTEAAAKTLTVRPEATEALPANGEWHLRNVGAGDLTLVAGTGVTINLPTEGTLSIPSGGTATLKRVAADEFDLFGQVVSL